MARILCVEDNEDSLVMLQRRLSRAGFEVTIAMDGIQGLESATSAPPDLIVMDLNLPGIDGWELTRRLKSRPETRAIPIIALSAHTAGRHKADALAAGCVDFEEKPADFPALIEKIRAALAGRSGSQP
jgi:CheY-like chemotaxis protein